MTLFLYIDHLVVTYFEITIPNNGFDRQDWQRREELTLYESLFRILPPSRLKQIYIKQMFYEPKKSMKWHQNLEYAKKNNSHMRNQQSFRTLKVRGWTKNCVIIKSYLKFDQIHVSPSLLYLGLQVTKRLTCLNFVATLGPFLGKYFRQSKGWGGLSSSQLISAEWRVRAFRQKDTPPKGLPPPW